MSPISFAWRSLTRQPARAVLGIAGIAVVGALLFDMLLLARGLVVSFEQLLDAMGFDVRVTATESLPGSGPPVRGASSVADRLRAAPEIDEVVSVRFGSAEVVRSSERRASIGFMGSSRSRRNAWTLLEGEGLSDRPGSGLPPIVVNRYLAQRRELRPGSTLELRGACEGDGSALPPTHFEVVGIADFHFDVAGRGFAVTTLAAFHESCAVGHEDDADLLLIASRPDAGTAAALAAGRRILPRHHVFSNRQLVSRFEATDFSYFRQISFALASITVFFAFLLIATMLTVSVNQRLAEVAALRALGFSRWRVAADLLAESALLVGTGGLIALPLGGLLALRLDAILRGFPGLPERLHFFVFEPRAAWVFAALLVATGALAALYPIYLAARLPIAATLRKETVS